MSAVPWQKELGLSYKHIALQCKFMAGELLLVAGIACVQTLTVKDRVYRQRAESPVTKPSLSSSLPLVSIPRSHYVQCHMHAHRRTGIPITARTEVPREVFCIIPYLGLDALAQLPTTNSMLENDVN